MITPAAYGNVVNVLLSTESSERIYDLRRSIFDFADRKLTFPELDPELTGLKPAQEAVATTTSARGETAAAKPSSGGAPVSQSAPPQTPSRPQTGASSQSRPWGEQPAKVPEPQRRSWVKIAVRWLLRNFSVLLWMLASFAFILLSNTLGLFYGNTPTNVFFLLNILGSVEGLIAAMRRKARYWLIIPQCVIALWISGALFFGYIR